MINEARMRLAHNKQRQRLKALLATAANGGSVVATKDLLACKLAKLDVGTQDERQIDSFVHPNHIAHRDCYGTPRAVAWKGFQQSLAYPELHAPGQFQGKLPLTKQQKATYAAYQKELEELNKAKEADQVEAFQAAASNRGASDEDTRKYHKLLKRSLETRFGELRRAFRLIDEDNSGACSRDELKEMLNAMFNLNIPENIMDRIIDLADMDGDGEINFAEFARVATEDDAHEADAPGRFERLGSKRAEKVAEINKQKMAEQKGDGRRARGRRLPRSCEGPDRAWTPCAALTRRLRTRSKRSTALRRKLSRLSTLTGPARSAALSCAASSSGW